MAELSKHEVFARELLILAIRWEFLRRNEKFREEFKPIKLYSEKHSPLDKAKALWRSFGDKAEAFNQHYELYKQLSKKWECLALFDMNDNAVSFFEKLYDPRKNRFLNKKKHAYLFFFFTNLLETWVSSVKNGSGDLPASFTFLLDDHAANNKQMFVTIDPNAPKFLIMQYLEIIVDTLKMGKKDERARFDKYGEYLAIYDLHTKKRKKFFDICDILYPNKMNSNSVFTTSVEESVMRNYRKCVDLIDGGYREIR